MNLDHSQRQNRLAYLSALPFAISALTMSLALIKLA